MLTEDQIREVLRALSEAGLCICEKSIIETRHPGLCDDSEYILGRLEESGNLE